MLFQWWHQWVTWWQCQQIYTHIPAPPHPKWLQHRTWVTLHDCNTQEIWLIPIRCTALPVSDVLNVHCVLCLWVGEFIVFFFNKRTQWKKKKNNKNGMRPTSTLLYRNTHTLFADVCCTGITTSLISSAEITHKCRCLLVCLFFLCWASGKDPQKIIKI